MPFVLLRVLVLCLSVCRPAEWALKLDALVALADKRTEERKTELAKKAGAGPQAQADLQRHIQLWRLRQQLYYRMRENFQNTGQRSACGISLFRCLALKLRSVFFLFSVNSRSFFPLILYFCSHNKIFLQPAQYFPANLTLQSHPPLLTRRQWSSLQLNILLKFY